MITHRVSADRVIFRHHPWQTLQDFCRESGAEGGINFGFFQRGSSHPHNSRPLGMIFERGEPVTWWDPSVVWHALVRLKDGTLTILRSPRTWQGHEGLRDSIQWACSAGPIVLWNGEVQILDQGVFPGISGVQPNSRVQRVAIGLTRYRDQAVFAYLEDATAAEMGQYLKDADATDGILGDGGSSASCVDGSTSLGSQLVPNALLWRGGGSQEGDKKMHIYIDPGHGGSDPGATGNGLREKDINLAIALRLEEHLSGYDCDVTLARRTDVTMPNGERTAEANRLGADFYFSVHCNAHPASRANGYEDFVHPDAPPKTRNLRDIIHPYGAEIWTSRGRANRGKKTANFQVLRETQMPAVLVEHGFISNPTDAAHLDSPDTREEIARQTALALADALGLEGELPVEEPETPYKDALLAIRDILEDVL